MNNIYIDKSQATAFTIVKVEVGEYPFSSEVELWSDLDSPEVVGVFWENAPMTAALVLD